MILLIILLSLTSNLIICSNDKAKSHLERISRRLFFIKPQKPTLRYLIEEHIQKKSNHFASDIQAVAEFLTLSEEFALRSNQLAQDTSEKFVGLVNDRSIRSSYKHSQDVEEQTKTMNELEAQFPKPMKKVNSEYDKSNLAQLQLQIVTKLDTARDKTPSAFKIIFSVLSKNKIDTFNDLRQHIDLPTQ